MTEYTYNIIIQHSWTDLAWCIQTFNKALQKGIIQETDIPYIIPIAQKIANNNIMAHTMVEVMPDGLDISAAIYQYKKGKLS